jgi:predicted acetyltransferase
MTDRYFDFLCRIVNGDGSNKHGRLLEELYAMDFYSLIPNDDNRGEDGKQLREKFIDEEGPQALSFSPLSECTVLEMLIGLSYRLEFETMSSRWEKTPKEWFWILLDNLGVGWCDNTSYQQFKSSGELAYRLECLVNRKYKNNGEGGLFPLKNPQKDQRTVEIWYQMSAYILENYPM